MLALFLTGILAFQDAPRLKTELPNKAIVFAERIEKAPTFSAMIIASADGVQETPTTHGLRHLLEHLVVRGPKGDLDRRLEAQGLFLRAETYRDYMVIGIEGKPDKLDIALDALKDILQPLKLEPDAAEKEVPIILSELSLLNDSSLFSVACWKQAYQVQGIDPLGEEAVFKTASNEQLIELQRKHFRPQNLVLAVSGDINVVQTNKKLRKMVEGIPVNELSDRLVRENGKAGRTDAPEAFGESRAALVGPCIEPKTLWTLAAAYAISAILGDVKVLYSPTMQNGLITVTRTSDSSGLGLKIDAMEPAEKASYFAIGRNMALHWLKAQLEDPVSNNILRGVIYRNHFGMKTDAMVEALEKMTASQFLEGFNSFGPDKAVIATGGSR